MGFISTLEGLRPIRSNLIVEEHSTFWCSSCFKKIFKDWIGYVKKARECSLCGLWQLGEKPVSIFSGVLWTSRDLKWHSGSIVGKSILIFTVSRRIYCAWNRLPSESNGNPPPHYFRASKLHRRLSLHFNLISMQWSIWWIFIQTLTSFFIVQIMDYLFKQSNILANLSLM